MTTTAIRLVDRRFALAFAVALASGVTIGLIDAGPDWDDTGITAVSLVLASAVSAAIGLRRPWLFALLVAGFVPLQELPRGSDGAPLFAFLFAGAGAGAGYLLARAFQHIG